MNKARATSEIRETSQPPLPAIRVRGLTKKFVARRSTPPPQSNSPSDTPPQSGWVVALNQLDMVVPRGSIYGFLGPNGAGKTTTLRILLGQLRPTAGQVELLGEVVSWQRAHPISPGLRRRVSYLPQDPVFPQRHTGHEVMQLVAALYELSPAMARQREQDLLERFDLAADASRRVDTYSRGMKQRLGLAVALLPAPDLILLDEPVSALDPAGRHEVLALLAQLRGKATVFFSSHILADVERICDHILILDHGQRVLDGPLAELLHQYDPRRYRLRVRPDQLAAARARLPQASWAGPVQVIDPDTGLLEVGPAPGLWEQLEARLVADLVADGFTVLECYPLHADLETVFLHALPATHAEGEANR